MTESSVWTSKARDMEMTFATEIQLCLTITDTIEKAAVSETISEKGGSLIHSQKRRKEKLAERFEQFGWPATKPMDTVHTGECNVNLYLYLHLILFKEGGESLVTHLIKLIRAKWNEEKVPPDWGTSTIILIFKKSLPVSVCMFVYLGSCIGSGGLAEMRVFLESERPGQLLPTSDTCGGGVTWHPSVANCHATRRKHEGWDTVPLPKPRKGKPARMGEPGGRGRVRTTDLPAGSARLRVTFRQCQLTRPKAATLTWWSGFSAAMIPQAILAGTSFHKVQPCQEGQRGAAKLRAARPHTTMLDLCTNLPARACNAQLPTPHPQIIGERNCGSYNQCTNAARFLQLTMMIMMMTQLVMERLQASGQANR
ncbi:hypothetical protein T265_07953 [Opisthorchis viverrini]|uniref:Uncharacterized protein n=1 Tax=Opisthorchis viverrini TaxID=6198 RepID=A0A075A9X5_OPIVI|nr:hypothetical protein T265_07953 [Opisthorchis viverrini]KER24349.1 hypothetical protein T265_07953 [Opisthorchis viverrini]